MIAAAKLASEGLQFGHGVEAVENGYDSRRTSAAYSHFNSATALKPWRTTAAVGESAAM